MHKSSITGNLSTKFEQNLYTASRDPCSSGMSYILDFGTFLHSKRLLHCMFPLINYVLGWMNDLFLNEWACNQKTSAEYT
jgi:hypothetical protein